MLRLLTAAFLLTASQAWATCWEAETPSSGPRAEICYKGDCLETTLATECGSFENSYYVYSGNVVSVGFKNSGNQKPQDWTASASFRDNENADYSSLTCRAIDDGACFPTKH